MRSEFLKQHNPKVLKIVKFDESKNGFVLHDHLDLTEINLSALAEINYGWDLWQHQQSKVEELQKQKSLQEMEINHLGQANQAWKLKCDELTKDLEEAALSQMKLYEENNELQKRVDEAQKLIDDWNCGGVHIFDLIDELEQALKGGGE